MLGRAGSRVVALRSALSASAASTALAAATPTTTTPAVAAASALRHVRWSSLAAAAAPAAAAVLPRRSQHLQHRHPRLLLPGLGAAAGSTVRREQRHGFFSGRGDDSYQLRPPINLGFCIVPQQTAYVVERLGKFSKVLEPGFCLLVPFLDKVAYAHSLKEMAVPVPGQSAITRDNVTIQIDGVLYVKIVDPYKASYGVENVLFALSQIAQTTMRSELGKISLDKTFEERELLNSKIVDSINEAAGASFCCGQQEQQ